MQATKSLPYFSVRRQLAALAAAELDAGALRLGILLLSRTSLEGIALATLPKLAGELGITRWPLRRALSTLETLGAVKLERLRAGTVLPSGQRVAKLALRITFLAPENGAWPAPFAHETERGTHHFDPPSDPEDGAHGAPFDPWNGADGAPFADPYQSSDLEERVNPPPTPSPSAASDKPPTPPGGPPGPPPGAPPHGGEDDAPSAPAPAAPLWSRPSGAEKSEGSAGAAAELRGASAAFTSDGAHPNLGRAASSARAERAPEIEKSQVRRARAGVTPSDAARNVIAQWCDAIGWRSAVLPAEWLKLCAARLADCGPEAVALALRAASVSPWHTDPGRRQWARLPGYILRKADRTIAAAEAARDAERSARPRPKVVPPPMAPAPTREAVRAQAPAAQALLSALETPQPSQKGKP